jgi:uncharacterized protein (DUF305 family)
VQLSPQSWRHRLSIGARSNPFCIHVAFLLLAVSLAGCSSTSAVRTGDAAEPESNAALEALYQERIEESRARFTEADVDFMTGMIAHHAQALVMSNLAPTHGASPELQTLASRIINAQNDEIATMQQWLRDRGQPVPEVHIEGTHLMIHGVGDHHMHMPGMLSPEQMQELDQARGGAFDRLYLTYMIQHHSGAVDMVHKLFATDGAGQDEAAFKLASDIQVDQTTEIDRMGLMLQALAGTDQDR